MKLIHATIRPGKVLEIVEDGAGAIKVAAPGLFTDADGTEVLPPVYPWPFGHHANAYSCPKVEDEVWVISFTDNPLQLHWVRKDDFPENLKDLPLTDEAQNLEVVVNREFEDSKWAILYFSNDDGWMMRKGEDGLINIRQDGSILLKTNFDKRIIDICEDSIALGTEGKAEDNAMLYSKWKEWADELLNQFKTTLMNAASANPYTANLAPAFQAVAVTLQPKIDPIKSDHVTITSN
jgi:hypothetical protein